VADVLALAEDPEHAFAGGARDVVDVEGDDLADPGAGVEGASAWSRGDGQAWTGRSEEPGPLSVTFSSSVSHGPKRQRSGERCCPSRTCWSWVGRVRDALDEKLSSSAHSIGDLRSGATSI
jgi:hypothetical protein